MMPSPGIEPGTHWWKVSALTSTPTLLQFAFAGDFDEFAIFTMFAKFAAFQGALLALILICIYFQVVGDYAKVAIFAIFPWYFLIFETVGEI